jgi:predicted branched-subunit amino acid permease
MKRTCFTPALFAAAFKYSIPVLLGYAAIGIAFGLLLVDAGYTWPLSLLMCVFMYAGAGQYIAVGLFAAGAALPEACLVQLVVNARHMAYGLSMLKRFRNSGRLKYYLVFALTDETFALLSSLPSGVQTSPEGAEFHGGTAVYGESGSAERNLFMFLVALLDQFYWVAGGVIGAVAGSLIPFKMEGISFALTALFVVLMMEQIFRVRRPGIFIISAASAVAAVLFLPQRVSLLSAMALALGLAQLVKGKEGR